MAITGGYYGILIRASSSIAVTNNNIKQNAYCGVDDSSTNSTNLINGNTISGNGVGIAVEYASSPMISDNYITGNSLYGIYNGSQYSVPVTITKNIIMNNGLYGIANWAPYSSTFITHNRVTGHTKDVEVGYTTHHISFNIYDSFTAVMGGGAVGSYNVKSDGTPAPLQ